MTNDLEALRRLRLPEVCALTGKSRSSVHVAMKAGRFPQPEKDGRLNFWTAGQIAEFLSSSVPASQPDSAKFRAMKQAYWESVKEGRRAPPKPRQRKSDAKASARPKSNVANAGRRIARQAAP